MLPKAPLLEYVVQYAYFGATPREGEVFDNRFDGFVYSCVSIINGIDIRVYNNRMSHCGDVAYDPEGCIGVEAVANRFYDCSIAGICVGYGSRFDNNIVIDSSYVAVECDADNGAGYQAFTKVGRDYGSLPFENTSITIAASLGSRQTISARSGDAFTMVNVNEWVTVAVAGVDYDYQVTAKSDNATIAIDNTKVHISSSPRVAREPYVIPAGVYESGQWRKSAFSEALPGLAGMCSISGNTFLFRDRHDSGTYAIHSRYLAGMTINGNIFSARLKAVKVEDGRNINITGGGQIAGLVYLDNCAGVLISGVIFCNSSQRCIALNRVFGFELGSFITHDQFCEDIHSPNNPAPAIIVSNSSFGKIHNIIMLKQTGDLSNQRPTIIHGAYNEVENTVDAGVSGNYNIEVTNIDSYEANLFPPKYAGSVVIYCKLEDQTAMFGD